VSLLKQKVLLNSANKQHNWKQKEQGSWKSQDQNSWKPHDRKNGWHD